MKQLPKAPSSGPTSEIRKHYFQDAYVIIAPKRNLRPDAFGDANQPHTTADANCHFCHNAETTILQLPRSNNWHVKVIANAFPALSSENPKAYGKQEIVIESPEHAKEFSDLSLSHIYDILEAFRRRLIELKQLPGVRYVLVFKNDGPLAGASVAHAHSQIFALPLVPPTIEQESDALNHYWNDHSSCAYCDIISWETAQKSRIITDDKHFIAISPYAGAYPYEAWLVPRRHVRSLADFSRYESQSLATLIKKITAKLDNARISFNFFLQESLPDQDHHFVLKIQPRTTKWAGAELATGVIINPVTPEYSALWYRGQA